ncbi:glycoside hydrolase family 5 protein [Streptomyces litchfieldiae]|uniref:Uncharacterized protein n=1 Tax=Streptomyces litchfieldiae TaxID=3075543 RepID=A0ABU2MK25_9ACTN|nr:hypothetical protein [Streptomyces sp. DSM 44938]MDT0341961.1 hypothetical protein [Streptomyces sp. DSM 44938]
MTNGVPEGKRKRGGIDRRTAVKGGLAAGVVLATGTGLVRAAVPGSRGEENGVITVRGQSPTRANIPTAEDPRASGGALLALRTAETPPESGWYATYTVDAPAAGIYRLAAVATAPVEQPHVEDPGSYISLTVNDGPRTPLAASQPHWYESAAAWGDLSVLAMGDVELRGGPNALTFTVDRPTVLAEYTGYRFLLDEFTLTPVGLALRDVSIQDPAENLGHYRGDEPAALHFRLNGRPARAETVSYTVLDYFSQEVTTGTVTVPAGATTATIPVPPGLPPGNYRVRAALDTAPGASVTGCFAHLPQRRAAEGPANRFGVNIASFALVPPTRLDALAAGLKAMGAGWVRDGSAWPAAQRERGAPFDSRLYGRVIRTLRDRGLAVLEVISPPPDWAMTETSVPLAADLRDAYRYAAHLAGRNNDTVADALHLSNEPDVDATSSTGDQHAAFVKAAALGITDQPHAPSVVLPGIAVRGVFQELMLWNGVVRYADVWSFHGYPPPGEEDPEFPSAAEDQWELRELYGAGSPLWMTECGAMLPAEPGQDLTFERQVTQARYLVLSTVESLAQGTTRQFWFCGPPCTDDGVSFAMLSRDFQPWPSFSAFAAMASLLSEAEFVTTLEELLPDAAGFVFRDGRRTVTVVYAPGSGQVVEVPVPGGTVELHDIMGARRRTLTPTDRGTVRVPTGPDPFYLVSDAPPALPATPPPGDGRDRSGPLSDPLSRPLSAAEHIVLNQRFAPENAAPNKEDGDAEPPLGYRIPHTARMSVDVYNFNGTARTVALKGRAFGGWLVEPTGRQEVTVPAMGRVGVEFDVTAGELVGRGVDYPLVFEGVLGAERVPPSVSLIHRATPGRPGRPVPLAPVIDKVSPRDGANVTGPEVLLRARVTDALAGVDPARINVEIDGERTSHSFAPDTGRLTASLSLAPGRHTLRIRAWNTAHASALATAVVTVRG